MERGKIVRSLIYKFTERFAVKLIGFVLGILLARLLSPEIAGQVALLEVFVNLSFTLIDEGINSALVQTKKADERDYMTVFVITLGLALFAIAVLEAAAPAIAGYYRSPEITLPLRVYAFSLLFSSFNSIQVARLQREMRFREMMLCNLAATMIAGGLGVALAYRGAGLWSLVAYHFGQIVLSCLAALLVLRWLPHGRFSKESAKRLGGFGLKMLGASVVSNLYNSLRPLIIGRRFTTADLGYYDRGQKFASTISLNLDTAIRSVMFPVLARSQDDTEQFRAILRRMKQLGCFVVFPVMFGLAAAAEPIVRLLLTEKWMPAVPFLVLLSIGEAQVPLTSSNLVALKSLGRSDLYAKQEVLRRVLMLLVLAVSVLAFDSVIAIAVGFVFSAWLDVWVTSLPLKRLLDYSFFAQVRDTWKSVVSSLLMAAAVWALGCLPLGGIVGLVLQIISGGALYLLINLALKNESLVYLISVVKHKHAN